MKLIAYQVHKFWLIRAALVLLATGVAECVIVWFAQQPSAWAGLIGCSLPFSMVIFVALPLLREEKRKTGT